MGTITSGVGLVSGLDTAALIESLITLESQPKFNLENQIAILQSQKTGILDINARLLNLMGASKSFRKDSIFEAATATSSNADILTATAAKGTAPGSFSFIVKQLVSSSQLLSKGFADPATSPVGLSNLSFEFGKGALTRDNDLEAMNGGGGVSRGRIIITDRSNTSATIDLTDVTTLQETIDRINADTTVNVTASVSGDGLLITDNTGQTASNLSVANAQGDTTATDLGIAQSVAATTITGTNINQIGLTTAIDTFHDGNGVLVNSFTDDVSITARDGTTFTVDFGRVDSAITASSPLSDFNDGAGVTISSDEANPDIRIVRSNGTTLDVDLTGATDFGDIQQRIEDASDTGSGAEIEVTVDANNQIVLTETANIGGGNLEVQGIGTNGDQTAQDLGLLTTGAGAVLTGDRINFSVSTADSVTVQDVLSRINNATGNDGKVVASINSAGDGLKLTDTTGSTVSNLIVDTTGTNALAASQLGFAAAGGVASSTYEGERLIAGLNSVMLDNLNGGAGLAGTTTINATDRAGNGFTFNATGSETSLSEIVDAFNTQAQLAAVDTRLAYNTNGNGLTVVDSSGGALSLAVSGDLATSLGITGTVAADTIQGTNLQHRYVRESSKLRDLNYGRGVGTGGIQITDGLGNTGTFNIGAAQKTLNDVITLINGQATAQGVKIQAVINANGDGLRIEEDLDGATPVTKLKIEALDGTAAADLNLIGESETISGAFIDGSYERTVTVTNSDSLEDIVQKINEAGLPAAASVVNTGSGPTPFRLNVSSTISGAGGNLIVDTGGVDLAFSEIAKGQDAKVFFGSSDPKDAFLLRSSTNTLDGVVEGLTIDLLKADTESVTVTVATDKTTIDAAVSQFVTTFNDVISTIDNYDFFNVDSEERGALLGDPTTFRVRNELLTTVQSRVEGVSSQFQFLTDVGIRIGSGGQLTFNQEA
ncbi:MAG: flagellar filament capping protein FliD, partial [Planctomycetota bacterium]